MIIDCSVCIDGVASDGNSCGVCGGDGEIDLTDVAFGRCDVPARIQGIVWNAILTKLEANAEELDYIHGKVTAIWNAVKPGQ